jgi:hypothetical protein
MDSFTIKRLSELFLFLSELLFINFRILKMCNVMIYMIKNLIQFAFTSRKIKILKDTLSGMKFIFTSIKDNQLSSITSCIIEQCVTFFSWLHVAWF